MDNIYENLENYDDVNIVHDLKNENKELKMKIEEYSTAVNRLQNEFDKLSVEYKKLEVNYSSLLKTARAEVERKTLIITNLNKEKDSLLIRAMQRNGNNFYKKMSYNTREPKTDDNKNATENIRPPSNKAISPVGTDALNMKQQLNSNKVTKDKHKTKTVENTEQSGKEIGKNKTGNLMKVMNRRKSMPDRQIEMSPVFSSEDEHEQFVSGRDKERQEKKTNKDNLHERNRKPEMTNTDSRSSNPGSSREIYHRERPRQDDYSNYHTRGKYDCSRYRRLITPEKRLKDFPDKFCRNKYIHRSPTSEDRYKRNKSRDCRTNYERFQHEYNNPSDFQQARYSGKHKMDRVFQEPCHKRVRRNSDGHHLIDIGKEREVFDSYETLISPENPYRSCQSPDHVESHVTSHHSVKEIMHTAASPQEDPRTYNNNYVFKTENDKVVLSISNENCNKLKLIDKAVWGIAKVKLPDALREIPSLPTITENIEDIIYRNIDNLNLDLTLESGEIVNIDDKIPFTKHETKDKSVVTNKSSEIKESSNLCENSPIHVENKKAESHILIKSVSVKEIKEKNNLENNDTTCKESLSNNSVSANVEARDLPTILSRSDEAPSVQKKINTDATAESEQNYKNINDNEDKHIVVEPVGTVEGDLLLSDDASDNMDDTTRRHNHIDVEKIKKNKSDTVTEISVKEYAKSKSNHDKKHNVTNDPLEKNKDSTEWKHKSRKKSQVEEKQKLTKSKDQNKRTKSRKEKEIKKTEIKTKFTDLFGDSSSLITPEDLGIVRQIESKFAVIFDDTQSAMDVNVGKLETSSQKNIHKDNKENDPATDKKLVSSNTEDTLQNVTAIEKLPDLATVNNTQETVDNPKEIYENLNVDVSMDGTNVVVISTGTQPSCDEIAKINHKLTDVDSNNTFPNLQAIATSTPHKNIIDLKTSCSETISGSMFLTQDSNFGETITNGSAVDKYNADDVPDVRIFVKRRRKVKKL